MAVVVGLLAAIVNALGSGPTLTSIDLAPIKSVQKGQSDCGGTQEQLHRDIDIPPTKSNRCRLPDSVSAQNKFHRHSSHNQLTCHFGHNGSSLQWHPPTLAVRKQHLAAAACRIGLFRKIGHGDQGAADSFKRLGVTQYPHKFFQCRCVMRHSPQIPPPRLIYFTR